MPGVSDDAYIHTHSLSASRYRFQCAAEDPRRKPGPACQGAAHSDVSMRRQRPPPAETLGMTISNWPLMVSMRPDTPLGGNADVVDSIPQADVSMRLRCSYQRKPHLHSASPKLPVSFNAPLSRPREETIWTRRPFVSQERFNALPAGFLMQPSSSVQFISPIKDFNAPPADSLTQLDGIEIGKFRPKVSMRRRRTP